MGLEGKERRGRDKRKIIIKHIVYLFQTKTGKGTKKKLFLQKVLDNTHTHNKKLPPL